MAATDTPPPEPAGAAGRLHNSATDLDLAWLETQSLDEAGVAQRCARLPARRPVEPEAELERLLLALRCIDLTTLSPDDTAETVRILAERAVDPLPLPLAERLGVAEPLHTAAVCVRAHLVPTARAVVKGRRVRICTVAAGFPTGTGSLRRRSGEVVAARAAGADEIDVVIRRSLANTGAWEELCRELCMLREAAGPLPLKVILGTGELDGPTTILRAGLVALAAGADFLKTSTGKERVNATLPAGVAMAAAIRTHAARTGFAAGLKAAGGISAPEQALDWLSLVDQELGAAWLGPSRFRIGASGLLDHLLARLAVLAGV